MGESATTFKSHAEKRLDALGFRRRAGAGLPAMFAFGISFDAPNSGSYNPL